MVRSPSDLGSKLALKRKWSCSFFFLGCEGVSSQAIKGRSDLCVMGSLIATQKKQQKYTKERTKKT